LKKVYYPVCTPPSLNVMRYGGGSVPSERAVVPSSLHEDPPAVPPAPMGEDAQRLMHDSDLVSPPVFKNMSVDEVFRNRYRRDQSLPAASRESVIKSSFFEIN